MTSGWRKLNDYCHDLSFSPDIKNYQIEMRCLGLVRQRSEMSTYFVLKPEGKRPSEIFMHVKG